MPEKFEPHQEKEPQAESIETELLNKHIDTAAILFDRLYGLGVPRENLPKVEIDSSVVHPSYIVDLNRRTGEIKRIIKIPDVYSFDGELVGEEMGHFYRWELCPKLTSERKPSVDEFFGLIGRKLYYQAFFLLSPENVDSFFPSGVPRVAETNKAALREARKLKEEYLREFGRAIDSDMGKNPLTSEDRQIAVDNAMAANDERREVIVHRRGYKFADNVDITKIKNWAALFSMADSEVRKRFFTDKPDYSGL